MAFTAGPGMDQFTFIMALGIIIGFVYSFGIGSNDVANSFASSVSAKSLTLAQAIVIASIFEFLGAISIGAGVTGTIRHGIIKASHFADRPDLLMFGMLSSLIVGSIWLLSATYLEFPVSTTHTILGAIVGMSIAARGFDSIVWKEVGKVIAGWVGSPAFTGTFAFLFFLPIKRFVMDHENSYERATIAFPIVVFCALTVDIYFVLFHMNTVKSKVKDFGHKVVLPAAFGGGALCAIITYFVIVPMLKANVDAHFDKMEAKKEDNMESQKNSDGDEVDVDELNSEAKKYADEGAILKDPVPGNTPVEEAAQSKNLWDVFAENTFRQDLHTMSMNENARAKEIWDVANVYDSKTEHLFSYLQVFTACLTSFAHGGNDIANAIAPLSACVTIWRDGDVHSKSPVPKWMLALGGVGIGLGFTFFGYRIIKAVGFKLTCITPSRGFCIELATAMGVATASFINLPVSSTQCLVGATMGAGIADGGFRNVQWFYFFRTCLGWAIIFFAAAFFNAGFFAFLIFSPNTIDNPIRMENFTKKGILIP